MNLIVLGVFLGLTCGIEGGSVPPSVIRTLRGTQTRDTYLAAPILRADSFDNSEGYTYGYETGNGNSAEASGALKKIYSRDVFSVQGQYRYTSPEGSPVEGRYVADENGYRIVQ